MSPKLEPEPVVALLKEGPRTILGEQPPSPLPRNRHPQDARDKFHDLASETKVLEDDAMFKGMRCEEDRTMQTKMGGKGRSSPGYETRTLYQSFVTTLRLPRFLPKFG